MSLDKSNPRTQLTTARKAGDLLTLTFFDNEDLEKVENLRRVFNQPLKYPYPILRGERPWESLQTLVSTVVYNAGERLFQMWYPALSSTKYLADKPLPVVNGIPRVHDAILMAYAVSKDGLKWEKPNLGTVDFNGSKENNLLDIGRDNPFGSILYEPNEPNCAAALQGHLLGTHGIPAGQAAAGR